MGIYIYLLILFLVSFSFFINQKINEESIINKKIDSSLVFSKKIIDMPVTSHKKIEEMEKILIKGCREAQAQIIICQECYLNGNNYCPYPTDSFCREIKNLDKDDPKVVWSFLPNNRDYLYKLSALKGINPKTATTASDLPKIIQYRISHTITFKDLDKNLKYNKPSNTGTDPCAVEGVVDK